MLNILSGQETANIKSLPVKDGEILDQGDWVVFDNGAVKKQTGLWDPSKGLCVPVYRGNGRFYDTRYLNRVDCVTAKSGVLETDKVAAVSIVSGDPVAVKDGQIDQSQSSEDVIGYAIKDMTNGVLTFMLA